ncbi:asparagine synthase (glutamine-hydrolyzing) [Bdellovibrio bacteriovorus]|uniref:asparagine synthase (glutamine-hydrolyzing) n=1 Tax=Bdellovibrio bacteriovorus TaxID=959 RepID=UPI0035A72154
MCGIIGWIENKKNDTHVDRILLEKMRDQMFHRGPDGGGTWISADRKVGLGHRRLSILDLSSSASQPMNSTDGTVSLVFNGEIYNYQEIKQQLLQTTDLAWRTDHSDTEVVLNAYLTWGIDCVHKFRGMFAIGIWDSRSEEMWLVRDRVGKKPIYYFKSTERFYFASEIKAIIADTRIPRELNKKSFFHYLSFLTTPAPETLFQGIYKIPPATIMNVKHDGTVNFIKYWDPFQDPNGQISSEEEAKSGILNLLRESVALRKVSDVPVGVFLSGGVDSSANAALFSENEKKPVKTFSIGYDANYKSYKNELEYARIMADKVGAEHYERLLNIDDFINFLPRMVQLQDEPIADPVCVPLYYVAELARKNGVTVCQIGEGSDELFHGYPAWPQIQALQAKLNVVRNSGLISLVRALGKIFGNQNLFRYEYLRRASRNEPIFWGGAEAFTHDQKMRLLHPKLRKELDGVTSWEAIEPIYKRFQELPIDHNVTNWMSYIDLNLRLPELLLMRVDKMCMGTSLEARAPFLDHKFVEYALRINPKLKLKDNKLKYILKEAVRGIVPDSLVDRKKQGFGVPVEEWFFDKLGSQAEERIRSFVSQTQLLNSEEIERLIVGKRRAHLWYIYNFVLWWEEYLGSAQQKATN